MLSGETIIPIKVATVIAMFLLAVCVQESSSRPLFYLDLKGRGLHSVPQNLAELNPNAFYINLQDNNIRTIRANSFEGLPKLRSLSLAGNRLIVDSSHPFPSHKTLESLDLSDNQLTEPLHPNVFRNLPSLSQLILIGNDNCPPTKRLAACEFNVICTDADFDTDFAEKKKVCATIQGNSSATHTVSFGVVFFIIPIVVVWNFCW